MFKCNTKLNEDKAENKLVDIWNGISIPVLIAGPCAVENLPMLEKVVVYLVSKGIKTIRAGIFKPRTSPEDFQGLGVEGLKILNEVRKKYKISVVTEIVDPRHIDLMCEHVDVLQIGTRNMQNYELLKELGAIRTPVVLKRGMCATIKEFLCAAEYVLKGGNNHVILCERGIRTYENSTRNTLDLSCVAIIKKETEWPIIVDLSHSLGRKDIILPMAKAALAVGADGIMIEVHPNPEMALSDAKQQMSISEFDNFYSKLSPAMNPREPR